MADPGRTVRVSGLPTDTADEKLRDKLFIHFLRARNGGGEIESVTIVKSTPASALVTFEDSRVAQRVIQHGRHVLEVDGKKHKVTVAELRESLDPDKVIQSLSATVDHSRLPGGAMALTSLQKSHPDIQINYDATVYLYTLCGTYSSVQAALARLLGHPGDPPSAEASGPPATGSAQPQDSEDQSRKPKKQRDSDESKSHRDLTLGGFSREEAGEAAALQLPASTPEEDFLVIVDADMFQYLQKHSGKEYQQILRQHGVEVVDMTNQGLTSLFLQVASGARGDGRDQECLKTARSAISHFFQENESKICRAQILKSILSPRGGLQGAKENLTARLPKLLLNEDELNVYIIGSSGDVSEAKQFLLNHALGASPLRFPSYDSASSARADEQRALLTEERLDPLPGSEEDERRAEGARRYKLAARFKDSGLAELGSRPTDSILRGGPLTPGRLGPVSGSDALSSENSVSREQKTGGDILFKSEAARPPAASTLNTTSRLIDPRPKSLISPSGPPPSISSGSSPLPPAVARSSSFSGTPQQKAQMMGQRSQDDTGQSAGRARTRSSSFSNQTGRDKQGGYKAEITTSVALWKHIKESHSTRVDDLTSDVQVKERRSDGTADVTVTLRGADSSKVSSSRLRLQRLLDSVSADFSVQELRLSELNVTDSADETLQACCSEIRSRFSKVTILTLKESLYLLGPERLCSQVGASLREVFSVDVAHTPEQQDICEPSTSDWNPSTFSGRTNGAESQEWRAINEGDLTNGPFVSHPSVRKEPVIKEKVKLVATEGLRTSDGKNVRSTTTNTGTDSALQTNERTFQQTQTEISSPEEPRPGLAGICVCGEAGKSTTRTKCGATLCSKCLDAVHAHCRVCPESAPTPPGIQGSMSFSKLNISVPGHKTNSAIKITYCIPEGVQEEGHPSPGKPFHGGVFEAFLPDCEKSRKLVPRLERAFRQGLTFTVVERETESRVAWDSIPHKTSLHGGKSGYGYPDSTYFTRLSDALSSHGIEEPPAKSSE